MAEILSPAGNMDALYAAVNSGADAVYLGSTEFSARNGAQNFTTDGLKQSVCFCHSHGVKVYFTLNTLVFDHEMEQVCKTLKDACAAGIDAVIIQDLGVASLIKACAPELPLHASTQMSVHSLEGARVLKDLGFTRVVLARELSREEIEYIVLNCGMETEVFVHGALCVCVSGQCYLSAMLGGRSGNRGSCAQPCRLPFSDGEGQDYALSLKDLSLIDHLDELQKMGVTSFKIEGRLKRPEYVGAVTDACRKSLNGQKYDKQFLQDLFSRSGFTDGYYTAHRDSEMFGIRSKADVLSVTENKRKAAKQIYKSTYARIPLNLKFRMTSDATVLEANGEVFYGDKPYTAQNRPITISDIEQSLSKLGGTPFYLNSLDITADEDLFLPVSALNALRRKATDALIDVSKEVAFDDERFFALQKECENQNNNPKKQSRLCARFENAGQIPEDISEFKFVILNVEQAHENTKLIERLGDKLVIELPRVAFEQENNYIEMAKSLSAQGVSNCLVQNIAHFSLKNEFSLIGGFGLNLTNSLALKAAQKLGLCNAFVSFEMSVSSINRLSTDMPVGYISYGYLPLMITRSCSISNITKCKNCKRPELIDRKKKRFRVKCYAGTAEIFNPNVLYLAERKNEFKTDLSLLYFTCEDKTEVKRIIKAYENQQPPDGSLKDITRGIYYK